jgi:hypothetical protein
VSCWVRPAGRPAAAAEHAGLRRAPEQMFQCQRLTRTSAMRQELPLAPRRKADIRDAHREPLGRVSHDYSD